jgi:FAD binding domain
MESPTSELPSQTQQSQRSANSGQAPHERADEHEQAVIGTADDERRLVGGGVKARPVVESVLDQAQSLLNRLAQRFGARDQHQYPPDGGINNVESLAGGEISNYFPNLNAGVDEFSPTTRLFINQDALQPILLARAEELGARLRYQAECVSPEQDEDGVTAVIRDFGTGAENSVRAKYVIAADGNRSPARERLGIGRHGHGLLSHSITICFRAEADLSPLLKDRNRGVHYVTNPLRRPGPTWPRGSLRSAPSNCCGAPLASPASRWSSRTSPPGGPCPDVADRFQDGRVFLAGDAAHVVPPNGGYGGNTGVQDAHNLAWKLALTLQGVTGPELLKTYQAERHPIGELTVEQAYTRYVTRVAPVPGDR